MPGGTNALPSSMAGGTNVLPSSWEEGLGVEEINSSTYNNKGVGTVLNHSVLPSSWEEGLGVEEINSSTYNKKVGTVLNQTTPNPSLLFKEGNTLTLELK